MRNVSLPSLRVSPTLSVEAEEEVVADEDSGSR